MLLTALQNTTRVHSKLYQIITKNTRRVVDTYIRNIYTLRFSYLATNNMCVHTIRETVAYRLIVFGWNLLIVAVMYC